MITLTVEELLGLIAREIQSFPEQNLVKGAASRKIRALHGHLRQMHLLDVTVQIESEDSVKKSSNPASDSGSKKSADVGTAENNTLARSGTPAGDTPGRDQTS